jgi:hypothetical protein
MEEGEESEEFWATVGGKDKYFSDNSLKKPKRSPPRLFQFSEAPGVVEVTKRETEASFTDFSDQPYFFLHTIQVEEVPNFMQQDLNNQDVMMLDAFDQIFIWDGSESSAAEKKIARETVQNYINGFENRPKDIPVIVVLPGAEPPLFKAQFHAWSDTLRAKQALPERPEPEKKLSPESALMAELMAASTKRATRPLPQLSAAVNN